MTRRVRSGLGLVVLALVASGCQALRTRKPPPPPLVAAPVVAPTPAPPRVVRVPTKPPPPPRACVPRNLPNAPRYPDTEAALRAAAGAADRYQLLAAGRILRQERLDDLERVVAGGR